MKRLGIAFLILVMVAAIAVALYVRSLHRPAPSGASLLPASSLLFVRIPDFPAARERLDASSAHRIWELPEVQSFLVGPRNAWRHGLGQVGHHLRSDLGTEIYDALSGEVFFGVTQFNVLGKFRAGMVIGADFGSGKVKAQVGLVQLRKHLDALTPEQPVEKKTYLGVAYHTWQLPGRDAVCYGFLNTMLVATSGEDTMRDVISRFTGHLDEPAPSLADQPHFVQFAERMPANHDLLAFVNMSPINAMLAPLILMSPQAGETLQKFGSIRSTGLSVVLDATGICDTKLTLYNPEVHQAEPPTRQRTLRFTTPETLFYSVGSSEPSAGYDQLVQVMGQSPTPTAVASFQAFQSLVSQAGIDPQRDFLDQLGPETAWTMTWRAGASLPSLGLVLESRNGPANRPAIDTIFEAVTTAWLGSASAIPWDEHSYRGHALRSFRYGSSKIAPTYGLTDRFFFLALTSDAAQDLVDCLEETAAKLGDNPAYQSAMARLPRDGTDYTYCNLRGLYPHLVGLVASARQNPVTKSWVFFNDLPPAAVMAPYLSSFSSATVSHNDHTVVTTYSPFGSPLAVGFWMVGGYAMAGGFSLPANLLNSPTATRPSSGTAFPPGQSENQTAASQTSPTP